MTDIERELLSALIKVGAECHLSKWQFDDDKDPTGIVAFRELHRIGDMAKEAISRFEKKLASPTRP